MSQRVLRVRASLQGLAQQRLARRKVQGTAHPDLKRRPTAFAAARTGLRGSARSDLKRRPTAFAAARTGPNSLFQKKSRGVASARIWIRA